MASSAAAGGPSTTNVIVVVDHEVFNVDREVLTKSCPALTSALENDANSTIQLSGISAATFNILLHYMTTHQLKVTAEIVGDIFCAASHLQMSDVMKRCVQLDSDVVPVGQRILMFAAARKFDLQEERQRLREALARRFTSVVNSSEYNAMDVEDIKEILKADLMGCRCEAEVFEACMLWMNYLPDARYKHGEELMELVRLDQMNLSELHRSLNYTGVSQMPEVRKKILGTISNWLDRQSGSEAAETEQRPQRRYRPEILASEMSLPGGPYILRSSASAIPVTQNLSSTSRTMSERSILYTPLITARDGVVVTEAYGPGVGGSSILGTLPQPPQAASISTSFATRTAGSLGSLIEETEEKRVSESRTEEVRVSRKVKRSKSKNNSETCTKKDDKDGASAGPKPSSGAAAEVANVPFSPSTASAGPAGGGPSEQGTTSISSASMFSFSKEEEKRPESQTKPAEDAGASLRSRLESSGFDNKSQPAAWEKSLSVESTEASYKTGGSETKSEARVTDPLGAAGRPDSAELPTVVEEGKTSARSTTTPAPKKQSRQSAAHVKSVEKKEQGGPAAVRGARDPNNVKGPEVRDVNAVGTHGATHADSEPSLQNLSLLSQRDALNNNSAASDEEAHIEPVHTEDKTQTAVGETVHLQHGQPGNISETHDASSEDHFLGVTEPDQLANESINHELSVSEHPVHVIHHKPGGSSKWKKSRQKPTFNTTSALEGDESSGTEGTADSYASRVKDYLSNSRHSSRRASHPPALYRTRAVPEGGCHSAEIVTDRSAADEFGLSANELAMESARRKEERYRANIKTAPARVKFRPYNDVTIDVSVDDCSERNGPVIGEAHRGDLQHKLCGNTSINEGARNVEHAVKGLETRILGNTEKQADIGNVDDTVACIEEPETFRVDNGADSDASSISIDIQPLLVRAKPVRVSSPSVLSSKCTVTSQLLAAFSPSNLLANPPLKVVKRTILQETLTTSTAEKNENTSTVSDKDAGLNQNNSHLHTNVKEEVRNKREEETLESYNSQLNLQSSAPVLLGGSNGRILDVTKSSSSNISVDVMFPSLPLDVREDAENPKATVRCGDRIDKRQETRPDLKPVGKERHAKDAREDDGTGENRNKASENCSKEEVRPSVSSKTADIAYGPTAREERSDAEEKRDNLEGSSDTRIGQDDTGKQLATCRYLKPDEASCKSVTENKNVENSIVTSETEEIYYYPKEKVTKKHISETKVVTETRSYTEIVVEKNFSDVSLNLKMPAIPEEARVSDNEESEKSEHAQIEAAPDVFHTTRAEEDEPIHGVPEPEPCPGVVVAPVPSQNLIPSRNNIDRDIKSVQSSDMLIFSEDYTLSKSPFHNRHAGTPWFDEGAGPRHNLSEKGDVTYSDVTMACERTEALLLNDTVTEDSAVSTIPTNSEIPTTTKEHAGPSVPKEHVRGQRNAKKSTQKQLEKGCRKRVSRPTERAKGASRVPKAARSPSLSSDVNATPVVREAKRFTLAEMSDVTASNESTSLAPIRKKEELGDVFPRSNTSLSVLAEVPRKKWKRECKSPTGSEKVPCEVDDMKKTAPPANLDKMQLSKAEHIDELGKVKEIGKLVELDVLQISREPRTHVVACVKIAETARKSSKQEGTNAVPAGGTTTNAGVQRETVSNKAMAPTASQTLVEASRKVCRDSSLDSEFFTERRADLPSKGSKAVGKERVIPVLPPFSDASLRQDTPSLSAQIDNLGMKNFGSGGLFKAQDSHFSSKGSSSDDVPLYDAPRRLLSMEQRESHYVKEIRSRTAPADQSQPSFMTNESKLWKKDVSQESMKRTNNETALQKQPSPCRIPEPIVIKARIQIGPQPWARSQSQLSSGGLRTMVSLPSISDMSQTLSKKREAAPMEPSPLSIRRPPEDASVALHTTSMPVTDRQGASAHLSGTSISEKPAVTIPIASHSAESICSTKSVGEMLGIVPTNTRRQTVADPFALSSADETKTTDVLLSQVSQKIKGLYDSTTASDPSNMSRKLIEAKKMASPLSLKNMRQKDWLLLGVKSPMASVNGMKEISKEDVLPPPPTEMLEEFRVSTDSSLYEPRPLPPDFLLFKTKADKIELTESSDFPLPPPTQGSLEASIASVLQQSTAARQDANMGTKFSNVSGIEKWKQVCEEAKKSVGEKMKAHEEPRPLDDVELEPSFSDQPVQTKTIAESPGQGSRQPPPNDYFENLKTNKKDTIPWSTRPSENKRRKLTEGIKSPPTETPIPAAKDMERIRSPPVLSDMTPKEGSPAIFKKRMEGIGSPSVPSDTTFESGTETAADGTSWKTGRAHGLPRKEAGCIENPVDEASKAPRPVPLQNEAGRIKSPPVPQDRCLEDHLVAVDEIVPKRVVESSSAPQPATQEPVSVGTRPFTYPPGKQDYAPLLGESAFAVTVEQLGPALMNNDDKSSRKEPMKAPPTPLRAETTVFDVPLFHLKATIPLSICGGGSKSREMYHTEVTRTKVVCDTKAPVWPEEELVVEAKSAGVDKKHPTVLKGNNIIQEAEGPIDRKPTEAGRGKCETEKHSVGVGRKLVDSSAAWSDVQEPDRKQRGKGRTVREKHDVVVNKKHPDNPKAETDEQKKVHGNSDVECDAEFDKSHVDGASKKAPVHIQGTVADEPSNAKESPKVRPETVEQVVETVTRDLNEEEAAAIDRERPSTQKGGTVTDAFFSTSPYAAAEDKNGIQQRAMKHPGSGKDKTLPGENGKPSPVKEEKSGKHSKELAKKPHASIKDHDIKDGKNPVGSEKKLPSSQNRKHETVKTGDKDEKITKDKSLADKKVGPSKKGTIDGEELKALQHAAFAVTHKGREAVDKRSQRDQEIKTSIPRKHGKETDHTRQTTAPAEDKPEPSRDNAVVPHSGMKTNSILKAESSPDIGASAQEVSRTIRISGEQAHKAESLPKMKQGGLEVTEAPVSKRKEAITFSGPSQRIDSCSSEPSAAIGATIKGATKAESFPRAADSSGKGPPASDVLAKIAEEAQAVTSQESRSASTGSEAAQDGTASRQPTDEWITRDELEQYMKYVREMKMRRGSCLPPGALLSTASVGPSKKKPSLTMETKIELIGKGRVTFSFDATAEDGAGVEDSVTMPRRFSSVMQTPKRSSIDIREGRVPPPTPAPSSDAFKRKSVDFGRKGDSNSMLYKAYEPARSVSQSVAKRRLSEYTKEQPSDLRKRRSSEPGTLPAAPSEGLDESLPRFSTSDKDMSQDRSGLTEEPQGTIIARAPRGPCEALQEDLVSVPPPSRTTMKSKDRAQEISSETFSAISIPPEEVPVLPVLVPQRAADSQRPSSVSAEQRAVPEAGLFRTESGRTLSPTAMTDDTGYKTCESRLDAVTERSLDIVRSSELVSPVQQGEPTEVAQPAIAPLEAVPSTEVVAFEEKRVVPPSAAEEVVPSVPSLEVITPKEQEERAELPEAVPLEPKVSTEVVAFEEKRVVPPQVAEEVVPSVPSLKEVVTPKEQEERAELPKAAPLEPKVSTEVVAFEEKRVAPPISPKGVVPSVPSPEEVLAPKELEERAELPKAAPLEPKVSTEVVAFEEKRVAPPISPKGVVPSVPSPEEVLAPKELEERAELPKAAPLEPKVSTEVVAFEEKRVAPPISPKGVVPSVPSPEEVLAPKELEERAELPKAAPLEPKVSTEVVAFEEKRVAPPISPKGVVPSVPSPEEVLAPKELEERAELSKAAPLEPKVSTEVVAFEEKRVAPPISPKGVVPSVPSPEEVLAPKELEERAELPKAAPLEPKVSTEVVAFEEKRVAPPISPKGVVPSVPSPEEVLAPKELEERAELPKAAPLEPKVSTEVVAFEEKRVAPPISPKGVVPSVPSPEEVLAPKELEERAELPKAAPLEPKVSTEVVAFEEKRVAPPISPKGVVPSVPSPEEVLAPKELQERAELPKAAPLEPKVSTEVVAFEEKRVAPPISPKGVVPSVPSPEEVLAPKELEERAELPKAAPLEPKVSTEVLAFEEKRVAPPISPKGVVPSVPSPEEVLAPKELEERAELPKAAPLEPKVSTEVVAFEEKRVAPPISPKGVVPSVPSPEEVLAPKELEERAELPKAPPLEPKVSTEVVAFEEKRVAPPISPKGIVPSVPSPEEVLAPKELEERAELPKAAPLEPKVSTEVVAFEEKRVAPPISPKGVVPSVPSPEEVLAPKELEERAELPKAAPLEPKVSTEVVAFEEKRVAPPISPKGVVPSVPSPEEVLAPKELEERAELPKAAPLEPKVSTEVVAFEEKRVAPPISPKGVVPSVPSPEEVLAPKELEERAELPKAAPLEPKVSTEVVAFEEKRVAPPISPKGVVPSVPSPEEVLAPKELEERAELSKAAPLEPKVSTEVVAFEEKRVAPPISPKGVVPSVPSPEEVLAPKELEERAELPKAAPLEPKVSTEVVAFEEKRVAPPISPKGVVPSVPSPEEVLAPKELEERAELPKAAPLEPKVSTEVVAFEEKRVAPPISPKGVVPSVPSPEEVLAPKELEERAELPKAAPLEPKVSTEVVAFEEKRVAPPISPKGVVPSVPSPEEVLAPKELEERAELPKAAPLEPKVSTEVVAFEEKRVAPPISPKGVVPSVPSPEEVVAPKELEERAELPKAAPVEPKVSTELVAFEEKRVAPPISPKGVVPSVPSPEEVLAPKELEERAELPKAAPVEPKVSTELVAFEEKRVAPPISPKGVVPSVPSPEEVLAPKELEERAELPKAAPLEPKVSTELVAFEEKRVVPPRAAEEVVPSVPSLKEVLTPKEQEERAELPKAVPIERKVSTEVVPFEEKRVVPPRAAEEVAPSVPLHEEVLTPKEQEERAELPKAAPLEPKVSTEVVAFEEKRVAPPISPKGVVPSVPSPQEVLTPKELEERAELPKAAPLEPKISTEVVAFEEKRVAPPISPKGVLPSVPSPEEVLTPKELEERAELPKTAPLEPKVSTEVVAFEEKRVAPPISPKGVVPSVPSPQEVLTPKELEERAELPKAAPLESKISTEVVAFEERRVAPPISPKGVLPSVPSPEEVLTPKELEERAELPKTAPLEPKVSTEVVAFEEKRVAPPISPKGVVPSVPSPEEVLTPKELEERAELPKAAPLEPKVSTEVVAFEEKRVAPPISPKGVLPSVPSPEEVLTPKELEERAELPKTAPLEPKVSTEVVAFEEKRVAPPISPKGVVPSVPSPEEVLTPKELEERAELPKAAPLEPKVSTEVVAFEEKRVAPPISPKGVLPSVPSPEEVLTPKELEERAELPKTAPLEPKVSTEVVAFEEKRVAPPISPKGVVPSVPSPEDVLIPKELEERAELPKAATLEPKVSTEVVAFEEKHVAPPRTKEAVAPIAPSPKEEVVTPKELEERGTLPEAVPLEPKISTEVVAFEERNVAPPTSAIVGLEVALEHKPSTEIVPFEEKYLASATVEQPIVPAEERAEGSTLLERKLDATCTPATPPMDVAPSSSYESVYSAAGSYTSLKLPTPQRSLLVTSATTEERHLYDRGLMTQEAPKKSLSLLELTSETSHDEAYVTPEVVLEEEKRVRELLEVEMALSKDRFTSMSKEEDMLHAVTPQSETPDVTEHKEKEAAVASSPGALLPKKLPLAGEEPESRGIVEPAEFNKGPMSDWETELRVLRDSRLQAVPHEKASTPSGTDVTQQDKSRREGAVEPIKADGGSGPVTIGEAVGSPEDPLIIVYERDVMGMVTPEFEVTVKSEREVKLRGPCANVPLLTGALRSMATDRPSPAGSERMALPATKSPVSAAFSPPSVVAQQAQDVTKHGRVLSTESMLESKPSETSMGQKSETESTKAGSVPEESSIDDEKLQGTRYEPPKFLSTPRTFLPEPEKPLKAETDESQEVAKVGEGEKRAEQEDLNRIPVDRQLVVRKPSHEQVVPAAESILKEREGEKLIESSEGHKLAEAVPSTVSIATEVGSELARKPEESSEERSLVERQPGAEHAIEAVAQKRIFLPVGTPSDQMMVARESRRDDVSEVPEASSEVHPTEDERKVREAEDAAARKRQFLPVEAGGALPGEEGIKSEERALVERTDLAHVAETSEELGGKELTKEGEELKGTEKIAPADTGTEVHGALVERKLDEVEPAPEKAVEDHLERSVKETISGESFAEVKSVPEEKGSSSDDRYISCDRLLVEYKPSEIDIPGAEALIPKSEGESVPTEVEVVPVGDSVPRHSELYRIPVATAAAVEKLAVEVSEEEVAPAVAAEAETEHLVSQAEPPLKTISEEQLAATLAAKVATQKLTEGAGKEPEVEAKKQEEVEELPCERTAIPVVKESKGPVDMSEWEVLLSEVAMSRESPPPRPATRTADTQTELSIVPSALSTEAVSRAGPDVREASTYAFLSEETDEDRKAHEEYLPLYLHRVTLNDKKMTPYSEDWEESVPADWRVNPAKELEKWPSPCVQDASSPVLLVLGGINLGSLSQVLSGCLMLRYNLDDNEWRRCNMMPLPRYGHKCVFYNDEIYIIGGFDNRDATYGLRMSTSFCFRYHVQTGEWSVIAPLRNARGYHGVAILDNKFYVVGGVDAHDVLLSSVERYNPEEDTWDVLDKGLYCGRMGMGVSAFQGKLWVVGGIVQIVGLQTCSTAYVEVYNPNTNEWTYAASYLPSPRTCVSLLNVEDKELYCFGGIFYNNAGPTRKLLTIEDVVVYTDKMKSWKQVATMPVARHNAHVLQYKGHAFVVGGQDVEAPNQPLTSIITSDISSSKFNWKDIKDVPLPISAYAALVLPPLEEGYRVMAPSLKAIRREPSSQEPRSDEQDTKKLATTKRHTEEEPPRPAEASPRAVAAAPVAVTEAVVTATAVTPAKASRAPPRPLGKQPHPGSEEPCMVVKELSSVSSTSIIPVEANRESSLEVLPPPAKEALIPRTERITVSAAPTVKAFPEPPSKKAPTSPPSSEGPCSDARAEPQQVVRQPETRPEKITPKPPCEQPPRTVAVPPPSEAYAVTAVPLVEAFRQPQASESPTSPAPVAPQEVSSEREARPVRPKEQPIPVSLPVLTTAKEETTQELTHSQASKQPSDIVEPARQRSNEELRSPKDSQNVEGVSSQPHSAVVPYEEQLPTRREEPPHMKLAGVPSNEQALSTAAPPHQASRDLHSAPQSEPHSDSSAAPPSGERSAVLPRNQTSAGPHTLDHQELSSPAGFTSLPFSPIAVQQQPGIVSIELPTPMGLSHPASSKEDSPSMPASPKAEATVLPQDSIESSSVPELEHLQDSKQPPSHMLPPPPPARGPTTATAGTHRSSAGSPGGESPTGTTLPSGLSPVKVASQPANGGPQKSMSPPSSPGSIPPVALQAPCTAVSAAQSSSTAATLPDDIESSGMPQETAQPSGENDSKTHADKRIVEAPHTSVSEATLGSQVTASPSASEEAKPVDVARTKSSSPP
ncbi:uncharacterized protein LOC135394733 isoform X2 [Ornithodoros turicata]|uniref:uncharacterized protein LOC135394733 isoform X2 n=1 Tax=Ornithodoros turicata TaxID=34597 RepID=UPI0031394F63